MYFNNNRQKQVISEKVTKLNQLYRDLTENKINKEVFPKKVEETIGIKWNTKANEYLSSKYCQLSFTNLLKVINLF